MLLMIRIWACLKCSPQVGLSCTMEVQQLYQPSSCHCIWSHCAAGPSVYMGILGTGVSTVWASVKSSVKETQHYYFAIGTYFLNTNCVLYSELEMIKREETEMIMLLIPQGGKMYKASCMYPEVWISFKNVENRDVVGKGQSTWGSVNFMGDSEKVLQAWFGEECISGMGEEGGAGV